jgi:DNA-binding transcriptional LysR family regulator
MAYLDNLRVFVRVMELGNLSAAGRDQRVSPAVASNRIKELEKYLGVRLFNRTTRKLTPTEPGRAFYEGAVRILDAVGAAEAAVADISRQPRGSIRVSAPLGIGKRLIAPLIPEFHRIYPGIEVRLRLSDRKTDITAEGLDLAFRLGEIEDSGLTMRAIMTCERVLCAAPAYLARRGVPDSPEALTGGGHACLLLRFPGSTEYVWTLRTPAGHRRLDVSGPFDSDDGDVLTDWALAGHGIVNKPKFEVIGHLRRGALALVLPQTPPVAATLACLYPHRRLLDPKVRLFIDFAAENCAARIAALLDGDAPQDAAYSGSAARP